MSSSAHKLLLISRQVLVYGGLTLILLGIFGSVMIVLIFSRQPLNENPCSKYIRANAILSLFLLPFYFLPAILTHGFDVNVLSLNTLLCKLLSSYAGFIITSISINSCFILFDRYVISSRSARIRSYSSVNIARKLITIGLCLSCCLIGIPAAIFYENVPHGQQGSFNCASKSNLFLSCVALIYFPIIEGILPIALAVIFCFLTRKQVRNVQNQELVRRLDKQITQMYLFQILTNAIASAPFAIIYIYRTLLLQTVRTQEQENIAQSLRFQTLWLFYIQYCTDFYIYFAVSNEVRTQAKYILCFWNRQPINHITCHHEMAILITEKKNTAQFIV